MKREERLDHFLAEQGIGTRKECRKFCRDGLVTVDGMIQRDAAFHIDGECSSIAFRGVKIKPRGMVYFLCNKPAGILSATRDEKTSTVLSLLPESERKDVFPVGRLDKDSHGLMLLTNDGILAHRLLSPRSHVEKQYLVLLRNPASPEDLAVMRAGMTLSDGTEYLPVSVEILSEEEERDLAHQNDEIQSKNLHRIRKQDKNDSPGKGCLVRMTLTEGKYHQIKRMWQARGNEVCDLFRVAMGPLFLPADLLPGQVRELTGEELIALRTAVGMK